MVGYRPKNQRAVDATEDVDLVKMALEQMWPVKQECKDEILQKQLDIIRDVLVPHHVRVLAAKNIMAMGVMNLKAIDTLIKASGLQGAVGTEEKQIDWDRMIRRGDRKENAVEQKLLKMMPPQRENGVA